MKKSSQDLEPLGLNLSTGKLEGEDLSEPKYEGDPFEGTESHPIPQGDMKKKGKCS